MATFKASVLKKESRDGQLIYTFKLYRGKNIMKEEGKGLSNAPLKTVTVVANTVEEIETTIKEYLNKLKAVDEGDKSDDAPDIADISVS